MRTLYVKTGCPWCEEVVEFLDRQGIEIPTVVVSGNPRAFQEMRDLSGQTKAPTLRWDDEILADFGVEELVPFLRQRKMLE